MPQGGSLTVKSEFLDDIVRLTFRDTGNGIDKETLARTILNKPSGQVHPKDYNLLSGLISKGRKKGYKIGLSKGIYSVSNLKQAKQRCYESTNKTIYR